MATELEGKKSAARQTKKILLRQIKKASALVQGQQPSDSTIHSARKQIKMARATLRLLRKSLPRKSYRTENKRLRDAAKPLSEARDATVLLATFDDLLKSQGHRSGTETLHDKFTSERSATRRKVIQHDGMAQSRRLLQRARSHAARWQVGSKGWSTIGAGLGKVYGRGRDALNAVRKTPTDEAFHEWRKQANNLRHQLRLLQPAQPAVIGAMIEELHKLTDQLGDDHDLAVLRAKLAAQPPQSINQAAQRRLNAQINRRRVTLQRDAVHRGSRTYRETPRHFCSRLETYWRAWRTAPKKQR